MGGKKYYWLKLKRDFFKRHDIQIIEAMDNGKDYVLFYLKILLESIDHEGSLRFSETIPYNEKMLSTITNTNIDTVKAAMDMFTNLGLVEILEDRTIYMNEVEKMLGTETYWAEQKRNKRNECNSNLKKVGQCPTCPTDVQPLSTQEIDIEKEIDIEIYKNIVAYLNQKAGTGYRYQSEKTKGLIRARLNEGFTEEDFITVIDNKVEEWKQDKKFSKFLRPETLFSNKFEGYLNEKHGQQQIDRPLSMQEIQKAALQMARQKEGRR